MGDSGLKRIFLVLAMLLLLLPAAQALDMVPDHVIVNSQDWRDVYSTMLFGRLYGVHTNFLVSTRHATILLYSISTSKDNILVLSNRDQPYIAGYEDILRSRGFANPEEIRSNDINFMLAEELALERPEINKYIVLDDAYGYNAISVAPFAAIGEYYVLFADEDNIDEVVDFLSSRDPEEIILYGQVDRGVKDALVPFAPTIINKGNRFDNNIAIMERYQEISPSRQVILTNGEFIESSLMSGEDPILFLGKENVPQQVRDYITNSDIDVGILIGNELVGSATFVRRQLGISVFVKFAQGARQPTGGISQVEDLDRFPMPSYELAMDIASVVYNKGTGALEVTYQNLRDLAVFFKSTITLRDGTELKITGDESPVFLDGGSFKTVVYYYTIDGDPLNLQGDELSGDVFTIYGEGAQSLENTVQKTFSIDIIDVLDDAQINITDLYYDTGSGKFYVLIENIGSVDAYVDAELIDLNINGETVTIGADDVYKIGPGDTKWIEFTADMAEADFEENDEIRVRAYYGERELALVKIIEARFALRFGRGQIVKYVVIAVIVLVVLLLLFWLGTKKKCKHCGHKNPRGRKTCQKCGRRF